MDVLIFLKQDLFIKERFLLPTFILPCVLFKYIDSFYLTKIVDIFFSMGKLHTDIF